jgi:hypothetical protein
MVPLRLTGDESGRATPSAAAHWQRRGEGPPPGEQVVRGMMADLGQVAI